MNESLNVTYNLSKREHHEFALLITEPLSLRGDYLRVYAGRDKSGSMMILANAETSNVMLGTKTRQLTDPVRRPPVHPWIFQIKEVDPLLVGADFYYISANGILAWIGTDKDKDEFIVTQEFGVDHMFLFRVPVRCLGRYSVTNAWPEWTAMPVHDSSKAYSTLAAADVIAGAQLAAGIEPGTGDVELDHLLRGLGGDKRVCRRGRG